LTRDGIIGNIAKVTIGNNVLRILVIYGLISIGLIYYSIKNFINQDYFTAIIFLLIAGYLLHGIINSINNSATPVIDRKSIHKVTFKKGITGLTRARFEVLFTDNNGNTKKRLIMLPGSLSGGQTETDIAYNIMKNVNLIE
jgi:hypothetical protein